MREEPKIHQLFIQLINYTDKHTKCYGNEIS
jgi:hypothetical protein